MIDSVDCSYSDGDVDTNPTSGPSIHDLISARYSRRSLLGSFGASAAALPLMGLAACENSGATATGTAPTVSATDQAITAGKVVTVSANATGATGQSWTQLSGPTVTLSSTTATTTSFVAPGVTAATPITLGFVATGSGGTSAQATSTVTVSPAVLGFTPVAKSLADVVSVPTGYSITTLYRLGDPIASGVPAFANDGTDTNYAQRAGDHHDGMYFFGLSASANTPDPTSNTRGILCINHENISVRYLHPNGPTTVAGARPTAEVVKEIECHGVSVIEVTRAGTSGAWSYVQGSALNRRITPFTPTDFSGPVAGSPALRTVYSPTGVAGRGTINNCANGFTPWGTYLTCEENWVGYFRRDASDIPLRSAKEQASLARNGLGGASAGNNSWTTAAPISAGDTRIAKFNITIDPTKAADGTGDFRNEINQYGWVVEIDPFDPASTPRKRTALGKFNHEGAWPGRFIAGVRPTWYMGDDAAGEYIYKFVSAVPWAAADATATNRLATGDKYLDAGTLYVARFNADGSGQWLPLVFGTGPLTAANATYAFANQADVLINSRLAADALGATRMDRPEWTAVNPKNGEMYCTLTAGPTRTGVAGGLATDAANPRVYLDPPSTARNNRNGHIVRMREAGDTTEATSFTWDIYVFAAGSDLDAANINISGLTADNDFSMPDGLWFSRTANAGGVGNPLLWIETDDSAYTDVTNCMLLVGQPGTVGDGTTKTVTNTLSTGATATQATRLGALPGTNLRRFLVGPKECEITGIDSTPDGRSVFVNIQHPGENYGAGFPTTFSSNWPASQTNAAAVSRPRSATIVITKDDGGVVGV
jgi:uncharacterized protein